MRNVRFASLVCVALAAMFLGSQLPISSSVAQDDAKPAAEKKVRKKPRGRLPNFYGQAGISTDQRSKIYSIQADYKEKIDALKKQIADLEEKQNKDFEAVLTPEQLKTVKDLEAAAKKRAEERRKKK